MENLGSAVRVTPIGAGANGAGGNTNIAEVTVGRSESRQHDIEQAIKPPMP